MKYKVLIVDDMAEEAALAQQLTELSGKFEPIEVARSCPEALQKWGDGKDLVIMDIQLGGPLNGFELARMLQPQPLFIFSTADPNFALSGYELDTVAYLIKPYSAEQFVKALLRAEEKLLLKQQQTTDPGFLYARTEGEYVRIKHDDILYVEAMENYCKVVCVKDNYLIHISLARIEEQLPTDCIVRVHRSFLVNKKRVTRISDDYIYLEDKKVPLARNNRNAILDLLMGGHFIKK